MTYHSPLPRLLTLGTLGLAACGEETTQPDTAVDQPTAPYLFGAELNQGGIPSDGIFIYDPVSDSWLKKPVLTEFAWYAPYGLTATRVFLKGQPRVEVVGGARGWAGSPGNNQQYIP